VGLHAGEYNVTGTEVVGLAFHIGARVAAKARPGEVLVSRAVKDLMQESEIPFKDRGVHQLKGVPGRWRLYRVDHGGVPANAGALRPLSRRRRTQG
jgi:class 3 adenylate cyclase